MSERLSIGEKFANSNAVQKYPRVRKVFVKTTAVFNLKDNNFVIDESVRRYLLAGKRQQVRIVVGKIEDSPEELVA